MSRINVNFDYKDENNYLRSERRSFTFMKDVYNFIRDLNSQRNIVGKPTIYKMKSFKK
jgi:hypothetical protein